MKIRRWKVAALLATSGVLLQLGGCAAILVQIVAQQVFTSTLRTVLDALLGDGSSTGSADGTP